MADAFVSIETIAADQDETAEKTRASDVLSAMAGADEPRLSLDELLGRLGDRGFGMVLLILGLLNCMPLPPGVSTIFGATMMLVAVQLAIGRHRLWLPAALRRRSVERSSFRAVVVRVVPVLRKVEALCRPRASWLASGPFERLIGAIVLVLAFVITLPIPVIGNIPPGIAVAVLAISLIERDGYAVLAGMAIGVVAFLINVGVVGAFVVAGIQGIEALLQ